MGRPQVGRLWVAVAQGPDRVVQGRGRTDRAAPVEIRRERRVELLGEPGRQLVGDGPQRADHMRVSGQLEGGGQLDRLVGQPDAALGGRAGGQYGELRAAGALGGRVGDGGRPSYRTSPLRDGSSGSLTPWQLKWTQGWASSARPTAATVASDPASSLPPGNSSPSSSTSRATPASGAAPGVSARATTSGEGRAAPPGAGRSRPPEARPSRPAPGRARSGCTRRRHGREPRSRSPPRRAGGVQRQEGQQTGGAPPHPGPRIALVRYGVEPEVLQHGCGHGVPEPAQRSREAAHHRDGLVDASFPVRRVDPPDELRRPRLDVPQREAGQGHHVDAGVGGHDQGVAAEGADVDDHHRPLGRGGDQVGHGRRSQETVKTR
ncbi:hypothetical protein SBADM41S_05743 [Streptomyces badius]